MPFPGPHAVLASPRAIGDQLGKYRIGALNQAGQSPVVDLGSSLGDVIEQARGRVGERRAASRLQECADFFHLPTASMAASSLPASKRQTKSETGVA